MVGSVDGRGRRDSLTTRLRYVADFYVSCAVDGSGRIVSLKTRLRYAAGDKIPDVVDGFGRDIVTFQRHR